MKKIDKLNFHALNQCSQCRYIHNTLFISDGKFYCSHCAVEELSKQNQQLQAELDIVKETLKDINNLLIAEGIRP